MCGVDPEVEGDSWGAGDSYHGDRVGGEGLGDYQGRRLTPQTTSLKHVSVLKTETDTDNGHGHDVNKDTINGNSIEY